jgi:AraC-like DNA-binding protein
MKAARDVEAYVADPIGHYVAGPTFLHFFADAALCGIVFWGTPDKHAIHELTRALDVELPDRCGPHATYVDARLLAGVDEAAFQALAGYVGPRAETFAEKVTHQGIVRPAGVLGAMVAGFYEITRSVAPERRRIFCEPEDAFRWFGRPDGASLIETIAVAQTAASTRPVVLDELHDYLATHLQRDKLAEVGRALGVSPRALQHHLRQAGTSFRRELNAARVRAAQQLLQASDAKLTAIAFEIGCASLQHFSTLFRKQTGHSPSEWRARHRIRGPAT